MFDYSICTLLNVSAHEVGSPATEDSLRLSKEQLNIDDGDLKFVLEKYFLSHFKSEEYFSFTFSNGDFEMNPLFKYISEIFDDRKKFHKQSVNLAKHLHECSQHPNIKPGDFYLAYFSDIKIGDETTDAIGLFKSETKDTFLKLLPNSTAYDLQYDNGVNIEKLDKGCLVFNVEKETGYKICIVDKNGKSEEAQYWRDTFLNLKPCADNFHHTKNFLTLAKTFVTERLATDFEVTKADQADYMNRSIEFFKKNDTFEEENFVNEVLESKDVIKSFNNFKKDYQQERDIEIATDFEISGQAVKKQSRIFKSVLKLDKNFHIYIHGDKELIEQGVEKDGRKYYKIYYKEEK